MIRDKPKEKEGDHMPRGQHPNSKKALAEARKKTQFNHERAVEAAKASVKARAQAGAIREDLMRQSTPETIAKANKRLLMSVKGGNLRAYEIWAAMMGEKPKENIVMQTVLENEQSKLHELLEQRKQRREAGKDTEQ